MSLSPISSYAQAHPAVIQQTSAALPELTQNTVVADPVTAVTPAANVAPDIPVASKVNSVDDAALNKAVNSINRFINTVASSIEFSIDESSGRTLIKVVDTDTNTVLRQFPTKEAIAISNELDKLQGLLVRDKA